MRHRFQKFRSLSRMSSTTDYLRTGIAKKILRIFVTKSNNIETFTVGSGYGAYRLPKKVLEMKSSAWLVGAGENIELDKYLAEVGWNVTILDPTPRSIKYVKSQLAGMDSVLLIEKGLWTHSGEEKFYHPVNPTHVSMSITNLQKTSDFSLLPTISPEDLVKVSGTPSLVKLDVEGAAYVLIDCLLDSSIKPEILIAEFEQPTSIFLLLRINIKCIRNGYRLVSQDGFDCLYVRNPKKL
jgi:hypothetical protein